LNVLVSRIKEVLYSVLPITIIVIILHFSIAPLELSLIIRFLIGAVLVIIGLSIFLFGVDIGINPIGNVMGSAIVKTNKLWIVIVGGLMLGFFISIAEPDLHVLADQVDFVTSGLITKASLVVVVSVGVGAAISLGFIRIIYNIKLHKLLTGIYLFVFILALFTLREILAIAFDASGATTGAMTVPFILALAAGVSAIKKDSKASEEDNFGLVGIASAGAIIAVIVMGIVSRTSTITGGLEYNESESASIIGSFIRQISTIALEVVLALLPILIIFIVFQTISFKLSKKALRRVLIGLLFTYVGFVIFLVGVNGGFMDVGTIIGYTIASLENKSYLVIVGFILGCATVLAEPAVHVLTHQVENVTSGYVKRKAVMVSLAIGVGIAVALSMIRILVPGVQLWHYLLPGYLVSLAISYITPELFVGIAFDSGGVASGPMTATFILAFSNGAAHAAEGANVLIDGFGMIAMVALTPLIALQILGLIFKAKTKKGGIEKSHE
jgi:hypothetical protein